MMYKLPIEKSIKSIPLEKSYDSYSTQINMPRDIIKKVNRFKKNIKDIIKIEDEPHITVLYGIKNRDDKWKIKQEYMSGVFGEVKKFEQEDQDVLYVEVFSDDLNDKHYEIRNSIENDNKYPEYHPHMTLAYVKKGSNDDLLGNKFLSGYSFHDLTIRFCHKKGPKFVLRKRV